MLESLKSKDSSVVLISRTKFQLYSTIVDCNPHQVIIPQMTRMQALSSWMQEGRWTLRMQALGREGFRVK